MDARFSCSRRQLPWSSRARKGASRAQPWRARHSIHATHQTRKGPPTENGGKSGKFSGSRPAIRRSWTRGSLVHAASSHGHPEHGRARAERNRGGPGTASTRHTRPAKAHQQKMVENLVSFRVVVPQSGAHGREVLLFTPPAPMVIQSTEGREPSATVAGPAQHPRDTPDPQRPTNRKWWKIW